MIADDTNQSRTSVAIHVVAAIVMGWVSDVMSTIYTKWLSVGLALVVLVALGFLIQNIAKGKDMKWWLGNGGIVYILFWIVTWVLFFNLG